MTTMRHRSRPVATSEGAHEAAKALSIGRSTAFKAVHDGSLPAVRISNRILISVPRLLAMLGIDDRGRASRSEHDAAEPSAAR